MELPEACIVHHAGNRLRLKIASRRGDAAYFAEVCAHFGRVKKFPAPLANALTGSLLFSGPRADAAALSRHAQQHRLFRLMPGRAEALPLMHRVVHPVADIDRSLRSLTGGAVDLPGGVFLALLGVGVYQLARGRLSAPPWYTAFWYAFGIISMYALGKAAGKNAQTSTD